MARILVFTPTYGDLLQRETADSVAGLEWAEEMEWEIGTRNRYPGRDLRNCLGQMQHGRRLALDGGWALAVR